MGLFDIFNPSQGAGFQAQGVGAEDFTRTKQALDQQQAFVNALAGQGGIQNQANVFSQEQNLANQLGLQAQGQGPNPALAQLAQTTGQNVANQAALMAGQRGTGGNAGLLARQAAQQGASTQQQAAGQAAVLRAQQQLAAQQALQQQQAQMAGLSTQEVGQQAGALGQLIGGSQNLLNSQIQNVQGTNELNQRMAGINAQGQQGIIGGVLGGAGAALGMAHGGKIQNYQDGGEVDNAPVNEFEQSLRQYVPSGFLGKVPQKPTADQLREQEYAKIREEQSQQRSHYASGGPVSKVGQFFSGMGKTQGMSSGQSNPLNAGMTSFLGGLGSAAQKGIASLSSPVKGQVGQQGSSDLIGSNTNIANTAAHGGMVKAMVSPGEKYLNPSEVKKVVNGKSINESGEKIKGKAKVKGDSLKNDTEPKNLKQGGIVIPRSIMNSENPEENAAKFVAALLTKRG